jgi:MoxR-like ATPase
METKNYPVGHLRASDADRDRAVSALSEAFQDGRISREEFEHRSGRALSARTGHELTDLVSDLPSGNAPATPAIVPERVRVIATWSAVAGSAAAAVSLGAVALSNLLSTTPALTLAQREARREIAQQVLAHQGISVTVPLPPPGPGFDWAGTITPTVIAVLLIGLIVALLRTTRTGRA